MHLAGLSADRAKHLPDVSGDSGLPDRTRESLGVVVVTFGSQEGLLGALRALLKQCEALGSVEYQVVAVDPTFKGDVGDIVLRGFPQVKVIRSNSDAGLAGAFNLGLRHLGFPSYILLTHEYIELPPGSLSTMLTYLRKRPSVAGVVPATDPNGIAQFQGPVLPKLVRGEVFFDVGLYDERLASNAEIDWTIRAKRKGHMISRLRGIRVIHQPDTGMYQSRSADLAARVVANLWLTYKYGGARRAAALYWAERLRVAWFAFRWRHDKKAVRELDAAVARMADFYQMLRNENRRPQLLEAEKS